MPPIDSHLEDAAALLGELAAGLQANAPLFTNAVAG